MRYLYPAATATIIAIAPTNSIKRVGLQANLNHLLYGMPLTAMMAINAPLVGTIRSPIMAPYW